MAREVRGVGELAPIDDASRWLAAELDGRVDRKLLEEGATVSAETVVLQLSNPDVEQAAVAADLALEAAEAAYASLEATLQTELLAGQRVARSANIARVVDPARLKAVVRVPEAQTTDTQSGPPRPKRI